MIGYKVSCGTCVFRGVFIRFWDGVGFVGLGRSGVRCGKSRVIGVFWSRWMECVLWFRG